MKQIIVCGVNTLSSLFNEIHSKEELCQLVRDVGYMPFFKNAIEGFSVEECTPPELWFSDTEDGPWEWKGSVIRETGCAYGKFFKNKAAFISRDRFYDFMNFRRDGYDYEGFYNDGYARNYDKFIIDILEQHGPLLSKKLKCLGGFRKDGRKGFDSSITRLQMQTFVVISDFEYMRDKHGKQYGWGVAKYATPEQYFGEEYMDNAYAKEPQESRNAVIDHMTKLLPHANEEAIYKFLGIK